MILLMFYAIRREFNKPGYQNQLKIYFMIVFTLILIFIFCTLQFIVFIYLLYKDEASENELLLISISYGWYLYLIEYVL